MSVFWCICYQGDPALYRSILGSAECVNFPFRVVSLIRRRSQRDLKRRIASTHSIFSILPSSPSSVEPADFECPFQEVHTPGTVTRRLASLRNGMARRRRGVHVTVRAVGPGRRGSRLKVFSPKGPIDNESLLVCERRRKTGGLFLFPSDSLVLQEVLKFPKLKSLRTSSNPI